MEVEGCQIWWIGSTVIGLSRITKNLDSFLAYDLGFYYYYYASNHLVDQTSSASLKVIVPTIVTNMNREQWHKRNVHHCTRTSRLNSSIYSLYLQFTVRIYCNRIYYFSFAALITYFSHVIQLSLPNGKIIEIILHF